MDIEILRRVYITASKIFPDTYKRGLEDTLRYAGISVEPDIWLGKFLVSGILIAIAVLEVTLGVFSRFDDPLPAYIFTAIAFIGYLTGSYHIPYFIAMNRSASVEETLPGALQLMASNIRAGMTPFQAMKVSARKEFGVLKDELDRATTRALGTASFTDALLEMNRRIKLPPLERSIRLFTRSIESGGGLARIMEESARDISENRALKKELLASTGTYTMLILFVIVVGAPLLLTISIHFTEKLADMRESIGISEIEGMDLGMLIGGTFTPDFLVNISTITLIYTSFIAGILIGVIKEGEEKYGLKYSFILVPVTLIIFYIMRYAVGIIMA